MDTQLQHISSKLEPIQYLTRLITLGILDLNQDSYDYLLNNLYQVEDINFYKSKEHPLYRTIFYIEQINDQLHMDYALKFFKDLLDYGSDPNLIMNYNLHYRLRNPYNSDKKTTLFAEIIDHILNVNYAIDYTDNFYPFIDLLYDYGADLHMGNPSPADIINSHINKVGLMPYVKQNLKNITEMIYYVFDKPIRLMEAKQRRALGIAGLPQNVLNNIIENIDADTYELLGNKLLENQYDIRDHDVYSRYNPEETYDDYRFREMRHPSLRTSTKKFAKRTIKHRKNRKNKNRY